MTSKEKSVYLIAGDAFMRRAEYEAVLAKHQREGCELQAFDVTDMPVGQILAAARSLPFLAESQIIRIKQADRLKEDGLDELEGYLKNPFSKTILILEADKAEEKGRLAKLIHEYGQVIRPASADKLKREVQYLRTRLTEAGKSITPEAQQALLEMCGESPMFLGSMLDRLISFAGDKKQIDQTMTAQFEEDWSEVKIFDLSNAIVAKDTARALDTFRKIVDLEGDLYSTLGFIHSQLKKLWQAKVLSKEGLASSQIAARLNMKPSNHTNQFFKSLERFDLSVLETAIEGLHELDKKAKTGRIEAQSAIEIWLIKLTAPVIASAKTRSR